MNSVGRQLAPARIPDRREPGRETVQLNPAVPGVCLEALFRAELLDDANEFHEHLHLCGERDTFDGRRCRDRTEFPAFISTAVESEDLFGECVK